jgi:hypothetical protein
MNEEAERIWNEGVYLASIEYYCFKINLYSLGKEFWEVYYHPVQNTIERVSRASEEDLNKYLNRIEY